MDGYKEILRAYLADRIPTLDRTEAVATGRPYQVARQLHIFSDDLAPWLSEWERRHRRGSPIQERRVAYQVRTPKDVDRFLEGIGSKRVTLQPPGGAPSTLREAWRLEYMAAGPVAA